MQFSEPGTGIYGGQLGPVGELPSILPWAEAVDMIGDTSLHEVVLGVAVDDQPVTVNLSTESPHVLVSAPTGAGKSAIARNIAAQRLIKGDMVVFLDIKMHSHRWARDLAPCVHYAKSLPDIGRSLVDLGRELHRRNAIVDAFDGDVQDAPVGPPITVVFEEMNSTLQALRDLEKGLPAGSYTGSQAYRDLVFMGRAVKIRLVVFAQLGTYRAMGGSEIVENFAYRILVGYSPQAWKWLAADCGRPRTAPEEKGRGILAAGGKATEVQLVLLEEVDATALVLASAGGRRLARQLSGSQRATPQQWRTAITS